MSESSSAYDQLAAIAEASFKAYLGRLQGKGSGSSSSQVLMDECAWSPAQAGHP